MVNRKAIAHFRDTHNGSCDLPLPCFHTVMEFLKSGQRVVQDGQEQEASHRREYSAQLPSRRLVWMEPHEHFAGVQNMGLGRRRERGRKRAERGYKL